MILDDLKPSNPPRTINTRVSRQGNALRKVRDEFPGEWVKIEEIPISGIATSQKVAQRLGVKASNIRGVQTEDTNRLPLGVWEATHSFTDDSRTAMGLWVRYLGTPEDAADKYVAPRTGRKTTSDVVESAVVSVDEDDDDVDFE